MDFKDYFSLTDSIVNNVYKENGVRQGLAEEFEAQGYVKLPNFFVDDAFCLLQREAARLSRIKVEKEFMMPGYNTPRLLSVIGGKKILDNSFIFSALYLNREIKAVLSDIVGKELHSVDHEEEFMVINFLEKRAGTHGWHVDDPQFALVTILNAPPKTEGGYLETIPHWEQFCYNLGLHPVNDATKAVEIAYQNGLVRKIYHHTGDCYFLNAGDCLHRVAPISGMSHRIIMNMAFDSRQKIDFGYTADILYGKKVPTE